MIIVTHDPQVAAQAERVIEIHDGEIVRNPPAAESGARRRDCASCTAARTVWRGVSSVSGFREALIDGLARDGGE